MQREISFELPWPPSVNKIYVNAPETPGKKAYRYNSQGQIVEKKGRGRYLTKDARNYKKNAVELIYFSFLGLKYGKIKMELKIVQFNKKGRRPDSDNGMKIVRDCIEKSGIIDNDRQIVAYEVVEGSEVEVPYWKLFLRPYQKNKEFVIFKEFLNTLSEEQPS
jgi:Holliday junction resolvase RusA-like endonuclease